MFGIGKELDPSPIPQDYIGVEAFLSKKRVVRPLSMPV